VNNPLQNLFQPTALTTSNFAPNSRYHGIATAMWQAPDGTSHVYLLRRFIPPPESYADLTEHTVTQGDRLDNITAQYLGDPELFWRVADANNVIDPNELTETIGRKIRITLPAGISG
jgi:nucleoid-associated protein YgaU